LMSAKGFILILMNRRIVRVVATIIITVIAFGFSPVWAQTETPTSAANSKVDIKAFVIQSDSAAQIRRIEWTDFTHLGVGTALKDGDLIDPKGQTVRILCADLSVQVVAALGPIPCPKSRAIVTQDQLALAGWQRGGATDVTVPYVISPRHTLIIEANPLLVWNTVPEADSYRVTVRGEGLTWSTVAKDGTTNQLTYPKSAPKLQQGVPYTVEIEALAAGITVSDSTADEAPDRSFTLASTSQLARFQPFIDKVHTVVNDKHVTALIMAQILADNQVYADALTLLLATTVDSKTSADWQSSPIPSLVMGDVYLSMGVQPEARQAYNTALKLAQQSTDLSSQALALTGLARLDINPVKRSQYAVQTRDIWNKLGASSEAAEIEQEFNVN
jgi:hypothetical protein